MLLAMLSCQKGAVKPNESVTDHNLTLLGRDTIRTDHFMGLAVGERAEDIYHHLAQLQSSKGVNFVQVVSNTYTGLNQLADKIPLYQSVYLDEWKGTDTGVQIAFADNKVKNIYLNSGRKIDQWPVDMSTTVAIRPGDQVELLYEKLLEIEKLQPYINKFERISLHTKDLSKAYDAHMGLSPQWYFTYFREDNKMDEVQLVFTGGKLSSIYINYYLLHK